ncbi:NAD(P)/FAD-dependent oxidoreductase [Flavobacterium sp. ST-75]|uniref:Flavin-dependent monooxygenase n=1 Tax=Flavobacterium rhizophilum TaxID=3163296 RepID=A0ABW8YFW4_9FLAO
MKLNNKKIAIVGGGPGGLTLARLLQLKGVNVKVYERDFNKHARVQGSPLDLHKDSGIAAMRAANLLEEFKKAYRPGADRLTMTNHLGEVLFSDHDTAPGEDFNNEGFRPEIDRGPLRMLLLDSLQPETVVWDCHFIAMEKQNEGWLLHFKNGTTAYADIVIAADGANSKIRPYLTDIKAFYSGITMIEVSVPNAKKGAPNIYNLTNGGKIMAFGNGKCLLMGLKGNGDLGFYISLKTDENWAKANGIDCNSKEQLLEWFKNEYTEWDSSWLELFKNIDTPYIPRPIYCMPLNQYWEPQPNLTLLGDAAHVMPPFAGEGVNMAMKDALELSEYLTSNEYATVHEAIEAYENGMRKRASVIAKESLDNGERMHSKDAANAMVQMFSEME